MQQTAGRVTDTQPASQMACSTLLQSDLGAFVLACSITAAVTPVKAEGRGAALRSDPAELYMHFLFFLPPSL